MHLLQPKYCYQVDMDYRLSVLRSTTIKELYTYSYICYKDLLKDS